MTLRLSVQSSASGDAVYPLISAGDRLLIGGGAECDLRLPDLATTGVIAELRRTEGADGRWRLLPTGTGAEVLFNGAPLPSGQDEAVADGTELRVGAYRIMVRLLTPDTMDGSMPGLSGDEVSERLMGAAAASADAGLGAAPQRSRTLQRSEASAGPVLVVINGSQRGRATPPLQAGRSLVIGRSRACHVTLPDPRVSRRHARLGNDRRGLWIRSAGGVGGVRVNGAGTIGRQRLAVGDLVDVGGTRLEVRFVGADAYERIAIPAGAARSPSGDGGVSAALVGGRLRAELDRWEVVDPVGLALGVAGIVAGLLGVISGL